jgi:WD40 repeat protein
MALAFALSLIVVQPGAAQKAGLLDRHGDPLPEYALLRIGTTRLRPNVHGSGYLGAMAFTRDGKRLVTVNDFSGAQVWDAATGRRLLAFGKPATLGPKVYALSADGSRAAVIESEKVCRFYDTASGKEMAAASGKWNGIDELRFSPNGKLLCVANAAAGLAVWAVASGSKLWHLPIPKNSRYGAFAFASDDQVAVVFRPGSVPPPDPKEERRLPPLVYSAAKGLKSQRRFPVEIASADSLAFSPDGKTLAAREWSKEFILWDCTTGKLLHEPETDDDRVWCLCYSPDSRWIVTGSNHGRVRLWDVTTGKLQRKLLGHDVCIHSLAWSPDSKRVAASCEDGSVRVWDIASGKEAFDFEGHRMRNVQARFSRDGKQIISICGFNSNPNRSAEERTFRFWDSTTGKAFGQVALDRKEFLPFCLSGDGRVLFVIDEGKITKRNLVTGRVDTVLGLPADYYVYRGSADGRYLAANTADYWDKEERDLGRNFIRVVDTTTGKRVLALDGKKGEYFVCDFTPDGHFLAVNTFRNELVDSAPRPSFDLKESYLTLWELGTDRKIRRPSLLPKKWGANAPWPSRDKLSPGLHLALTRGKDGVELRELATNGKVSEPSAGSWQPESWAFSGDGRFIAVGNEKGQILLWSVFPPKNLVTLSGHAAAVTSLRFSPDARRLVSGSDDTTILSWDVSRWTAVAAKPVPLGTNAVKLWNDLADADAAKGCAAIGELLGSPKETVAFLRRDLRPADGAGERKLLQLVTDLESDQFAVRQQATVQLQKLGFMAVSALEKALRGAPTLEKRRRVEQLLARLQTQPLSGDSLRATRALQVLEVLGTANAMELLGVLASGEQAAWLTHEAALSLERGRERARAAE